MKRFLSALLSFVMIFTSLVTALPVKAQDMPRVTPTKDKIIESGNPSNPTDPTDPVEPGEDKDEKPQIGNDAKYHVIMEEPAASNRDAYLPAKGGFVKFRYDSKDLKEADMEYLVYKDGKKIDFKFSSIISHDGQYMDGVEFSAKLDPNTIGKEEVYEFYIKEKKDLSYDEKNIIKITVIPEAKEDGISALGFYEKSFTNKDTNREFYLNIYGKNLSEDNIKYEVKKSDPNSKDLTVAIKGPFFDVLPANANISVPENNLGKAYTYTVDFWTNQMDKKRLTIKVGSDGEILPDPEEPSEDEYVLSVSSKKTELESAGGTVTIKLTTKPDPEKIITEILLNGVKIEESAVSGSFVMKNTYFATLPENTSDKDNVYTFKFKGENDKNFKQVLVTVKKNESPTPSVDFSIQEDPNSEKDFTLENAGGEVSFSIFVIGNSKEITNDMIEVKSFDGDKEVNLSPSISGLKARRTIKLTLPKNETEVDKVYKIFVSPKGKENSDKIEVRVTVKKLDIVKIDLDELNVKYPELKLEGGEQTITIKGKNLDKAKSKKISLFDISSGMEVDASSNFEIKDDFIGNDKVQTAKINLFKVDKDTEYKIYVDLDGNKISNTFSQTKDANTNDLQVIAPKRSFLIDDNTLAIEFFVNVLAYKEGSIEKGLSINNDIKMGPNDKVEINNDIIKITFAEPIFKDRTKTYSLHMDERSIMDYEKEPNRAFNSTIIRNEAIVLESHFESGYQNPPKDGKVVYKLSGYNLGDNLKFKIQKNTKNKELFYSSDNDEADNIIKDFKVEGDDKNRTISFTAPENTTDKLETYTIMVSVNGGVTYESTLGASLEERFKRSIIAVFPEGADTKKSVIDFIQIQSYGTQGGSEQADITHTDLPTNQGSKKTLLWISGTNLDAHKSRIRLIDENGVYWSPIYDATHDSGDRVMMTMLDGMKDGKSFGMTGSGNNMLMEVILPNGYKPKEGHDGRVYRYQVAPDGVNFNEEAEVTANVVFDKAKGKTDPDENLIDVVVRHTYENGKDIVEPRTIKAYKHLPPNVFHYMLPFYTENGEYKEGFLGYKLKDTDELVFGREGFGTSKHYYYDKNITELLNSKGEIVLVYENPVEINKTELQGLVDKAKKIDLTNKTEDSKKALEEAIKEAEEVLENATSQEEIDKAKEALQKAIDGLEEKPVELNKTELQKLVDSAKKIDLTNKTEESKKALEEAIKKAEEALENATSQEEIDKAKEALEKAIEGLKEKPQKPVDPTPGEVPGTDPIPGEKPGTKPDPKPEVKPEPKPEVKPEKNIFDGIEKERQAGDNRYKTAVEISKKNFESAETVILVNGEKEADALAASVLAKEKNAPILLIKKDMTPDEVAKEIERLGAKNIILIGGLNSVTQKAVENLKLDLNRIAGKDRFETAVEIAKAAGKTEKLILANGQSLVDALTASSLAQVENRGIILVNKDSIPECAKELVEKAKDILIVGGENSVKLGVKADRISGKDRFETAVKIAERAFVNPKQIALANSTAYADALVFGGVTGKVEAPILLTNKDKLPQVVKEYLERNKIEKIFVLGGENSVSENLFK